MTTKEQAIELVKRYTEVRSLDELDDIFTPDFINHSSAGTQQGIDKLKEFISSVGDMFLDVKVTIDTIFADKRGDGEPWVGALVTLRGTKADNKQAFEMQELWVFRISEGKIAERWFVVNRPGGLFG